jgi:uncharacterized membrane protein YeiB
MPELQPTPEFDLQVGHLLLPEPSGNVGESHLHFPLRCVGRSSLIVLVLDSVLALAPFSHYLYGLFRTGSVSSM